MQLLTNRKQPSTMVDMEQIEIGQRVKTLRDQRDWTLRELARRAKVSPSYLSRLEDGYTNPKLSELRQVAVALEVPLALIVGDSNSGEIEKRLNANPALARDVSAIAEGYQWCDSNQRAIVDSLLSAIVRVVTPNGQSKDQNSPSTDLTEGQSRYNANYLDHFLAAPANA